jgi:hypothetical protein
MVLAWGRSSGSEGATASSLDDDARGFDRIRREKVDDEAPGDHHRSAGQNRMRPARYTAGFDDGEISEIVAHVALNFFVGIFSKVARPEAHFPAVPLTTDEAYG